MSTGAEGLGGRAMQWPNKTDTLVFNKYLNLSDARFTDSGQYWCEAHNEFGSAFFYYNFRATGERMFQCFYDGDYLVSKFRAFNQFTYFLNFVPTRSG